MLNGRFVGGIFGLLGIVGVRASEIPSIDDAWDLKRVAAYAIEHSPSLLAARDTLTAADKTNDNAFAALFPVGDLKVNQGYGTPAANSGASGWIGNAGAYLTASIYDNGKTGTLYQSSKIAREIARLSYEGARDSLLLDIEKAFQDYSLALKSYEVSLQEHDILERQFKSADLQHRQGLKTRLDVLRFKIQFQRAEIEQQNARESARQGAERILTLMGVADRAVVAAVPLKTPFRAVDLQQGPTVIPTAALDPEKVRELRISRLATLVAKTPVELAKRALWPELNLTAGADYVQSGYLDSAGAFDTKNSRGRFEWSTLMGLSYRFFDWGQRGRESEIQVANQLRAEHEAGQKYLTVQETLSNLMRELARLNETHRQARELLSMEQSNFDYIDQQYREGKSTYLDLIDGLKNLLSARKSYFSTVRDLLARNAEYRFYEGTIHEAILGSK